MHSSKPNASLNNYNFNLTISKRCNMAIRILHHRNRYAHEPHITTTITPILTPWIGLTWRESLGIVALAFFIISFVIALNGAIGVLHHVPFPVIARASWGFWGSYIAIISRAILAVFWFAIQNMNGANSVRVMIGAIWPSFLTLHNGIPKSQGIDTPTMISFFLFWLASVPFLCMHPNNLRWLFMAKSVVVPVAWIAILIWAFVSTRGEGDMWDQEAKLEGSAYSWAFLSSLTSVIGNYATLSVNQVSSHTPPSPSSRIV
jgi:NCS1 family nucleobase:cation symporter-1